VHYAMIGNAAAVYLRNDVNYNDEEDE